MDEVFFSIKYSGLFYSLLLSVCGYRAIRKPIICLAVVATHRSDKVGTVYYYNRYLLFTKS